MSTGNSRDCMLSGLYCLADNVHYSDFSPYEVADVLKQYFRDLPERLFTHKLSESLILISACNIANSTLQHM